ncbi:Fe(II)-2OG oxygenase family protein [Serratia quinivorans]|uniref:TauD/TfdA family dioxygenase n=1 Tax=Serratia quinivorans TaxID=137545 RepID=UPI00217A52C1|nr:TauD/TfdA family dioxygenase [Serratia quinivorans]CAI1544090.1 Taurine catabolism dioxygenase TauD, TfdA family [Serratia quinivorans]
MQINLQFELEKNGYLFIPGYIPEISTIELGHRIGKVIDIGKKLKGVNVSVVQTITPKDIYEAGGNVYSGIFGLRDFPFHTDLAHWANPPRYLMLRCIKGSPDVTTGILTFDEILKKIPLNELNKSIFIARKKDFYGRYLPVSLTIGNSAIRWDSEFLKPINDRAKYFFNWMKNKEWKGSEIKLNLKNYGDTLIIDNWRTLHCRSSVNNRDRIIERMYLSEVIL